MDSLGSGLATDSLKISVVSLDEVVGETCSEGTSSAATPGRSNRFAPIMTEKTPKVVFLIENFSFFPNISL